MSEIDKESFYIKRIQELEAKVESLERLVEQLMAELAKYKTPKNSSNSSIPPSHDIVKIPRTQSLREPSGRKPGGQKGREGLTLKRTPNPDVVIDCKPTVCERCGSDLTEQKATQKGSYQEVDIPPIKPVWTEYRQFEIKCTCGHHNCEALPHRGAVYGPRIQAYVSCLSVEQSLPYQRITQLLKEMFGLSLSEGTIDSMLKRMSNKVKEFYEKIRKSVRQSAVTGSDETGLRVSGKLHWIWVWQSNNATYLAVNRSRGSATVEANFPEGFKLGFLVHDRLAAQTKTEAGAHQFCMAHILRELKYIQQVEPKNIWAKELEGLIKETIGLEKELGSDQRERDLMLADAQMGLKRILQAEAYGKEACRLKAALEKHSDKLWHYIENEEVPATNNASERALRNVKVKQNVATSIRTFFGAEIFCILRSVCDTCKKQGSSFFEILLKFSLLPSSG